MKVRRGLGGVLFGVGCAVVFIGLLGAVLPMIANDQLSLVLSSFSMPSQNVIVNAINVVMSYALGNCYLVMLLGAGGMLVGALLFLWDGRKRAPVAQNAQRPREIVSAQETVEWYAPAPQRRSNPFADLSVSQMLEPTNAPQRQSAAPYASYEPIVAVQQPYAAQPSPYERPVETYAPPVEPAQAAYDMPAEAPLAPQPMPTPVEPQHPETAAATLQPSATRTERAIADAIADALAMVEPGRMSQSGARIMQRSVQPAQEEVPAPVPLPQLAPAMPAKPAPIPAPVAAEPVVQPRVAEANATPAVHHASTLKPAQRLASAHAVAATPAPVEAAKPAQPVYTPNEPEQPPVSTRIRSTMGKHS